MKAFSLKISFIQAFLFCVLAPVVVPQVRLWGFAPFLALLFYRSSFLHALWGAFFCGLVVDCFSSQFSFGLFTLLHVLIVPLLYKQKKHFFEDKPLAFSLYSVLIASCLSAFLLLFDRQFPLSLKLFFSDLILMPALEGLYAFIWFICPSRLYSFSKKRLFQKSLSTEEV